MKSKAEHSDLQIPDTECPRMEAEEMLGNEAKALVTSEADDGPYLEIPKIPEEPEIKLGEKGSMKEYRWRYNNKPRWRRQWQKRC